MRFTKCEVVRKGWHSSSFSGDGKLFTLTLIRYCKHFILRRIWRCVFPFRFTNFYFKKSGWCHHRIQLVKFDFWNESLTFNDSRNNSLNFKIHTKGWLNVQYTTYQKQQQSQTGNGTMIAWSRSALSKKSTLLYNIFPSLRFDSQCSEAVGIWRKNHLVHALTTFHLGFYSQSWKYKTRFILMALLLFFEFPSMKAHA